MPRTCGVIDCDKDPVHNDGGPVCGYHYHAWRRPSEHYPCAVCGATEQTQLPYTEEDADADAREAVELSGRYANHSKFHFGQNAAPIFRLDRIAPHLAPMLLPAYIREGRADKWTLDVLCPAADALARVEA